MLSHNTLLTAIDDNNIEEINRHLLLGIDLTTIGANGNGLKNAFDSFLCANNMSEFRNSQKTIEFLLMHKINPVFNIVKYSDSDITNQIYLFKFFDGVANIVKKIDLVLKTQTKIKSKLKNNPNYSSLDLSKEIYSQDFLDKLKLTITPGIQKYWSFNRKDLKEISNVLFVITSKIERFDFSNTNGTTFFNYLITMDYKYKEELLNFVMKRDKAIGETININYDGNNAISYAIKNKLSVSVIEQMLLHSGKFNVHVLHGLELDSKHLSIAEVS